MLKKLFVTSLLFIAVLLMLGIAQFCLSSSQNPRIIRVPNNYPTIQEAVDAASPEDTLLVAPGVYYENVVINKPLRLVGEDRNDTIIDGGGYNWDRMTKAISVFSGNVTIEGFTIKNAFYGIYAEGVDGLILQNLILTSNAMGVRVINTHAAIIQKSVAFLNVHGIFVEDSSMCIIKDNTLANNWGGYPDLLLGGGIDLVGSNNSIVANNFLTEHRVATIELAEAYRNIVANNTTVKNGHGGIEIHGSHENLIVNNTSIEDETGVYIGGGSTGNFVIGNFASEGGVAGIAVISSMNNFYTKNILSNKYAGFA
ncbi:MAG: NosD domain-containing protein [Candidatus Bathyarchaeia archaeon]